MTCGRCKEPINGIDEVCWWCIDPMCSPCWEAHGHCGHPEADAVNADARAARRYLGIERTGDADEEARK